jgi:hypothetical protein
VGYVPAVNSTSGREGYFLVLGEDDDWIELTARQAAQLAAAFNSTDLAGAPT